MLEDKALYVKFGHAYINYIARVLWKTLPNHQYCSKMQLLIQLVSLGRFRLSLGFMALNSFGATYERTMEDGNV